MIFIIIWTSVMVGWKYNNIMNKEIEFKGKKYKVLKIIEEDNKVWVNPKQIVTVKYYLMMDNTE